MFSKILVATDLSEASDRVISCLQGLRRLGAEKAILIHALGLKHIEDLARLLTPMVEPKLLAQKAMIESQGFEATIEIAPGIPELEINRIAKEKGVSLTIVGSHGASLMKEITLGSVAFKIIRNAVTPVLVVRLEIKEEGSEKRCEVACSDLLNNILYPTDFSDTSERAFAYVGRIVEGGAKRVTLLHVQDKARIAKHLEDRLEEFNRIDQERFARLKAKLIEKGATDVRIEIPYGSPIQEILRRTKSEDFSLVVMGSQGRGFIPEILIGSVSHNVVHQAPIPVLLVPALR
ncbi:MAG: universal stress protein [Chloroflexi bacterium]|nr:universal stress protein [Chloroflexota bacterium]